jgi:hypothetical protein
MTNSYNAKQFNNTRTRQGWVTHLSTQQWAHVVTLTFKYAYSREAIRKHFLDWIRALEWLAQGPIIWHRATEIGKKGRGHIHALITSTEKIKNREMEKRWRHGRAVVRRYISHRGAEHYVTKDIMKDEADYESSKRWIWAADNNDDDGVDNDFEDELIGGYPEEYGEEFFEDNRHDNYPGEDDDDSQ